MANPNNELSLKQACEALGITRQQLFEMADRGEIRIYSKPYNGITRRFVLREDLRRLLAKLEEAQDMPEKSE